MIWVNTPDGFRMQAGAGSPLRYVVAATPVPNLPRPRPIGTMYPPPGTREMQGS